MFAKRRRPWKRGPKMRYSVYKAEDRAEGEEDYKEWALTMARAKGYNVEDFHPEPHHRNFWHETYNRMSDHWIDEGKP